MRIRGSKQTLVVTQEKTRDTHNEIHRSETETETETQRMAAGCCLQLLICYPYETQSQLRTRVSASWNSSSSSFSTSRSIYSLIGKTGICSPRIRVGRSSSCGQRQQQQQQHKHGAIAGGGARREGKSRKMRVYVQAGRDSSSSSSSSSSNPNDGGGGEEGRLPWSSRDEFGLYPWDPSWGDLESMGKQARNKKLRNFLQILSSLFVCLLFIFQQSAMEDDEEGCGGKKTGIC